jgi:enterochelin esterase-like enzyme
MSLAPVLPDAVYHELQVHSAFRSRFVPASRDLVVYLPPGYQLDSERRYPVLYLQDGQNLFDGNTSFIRGQYWRAGETADWLIKAGSVEPVIIVGIYNAGDHRLDEYTPTPDRRGRGGKASLYGRMIVEELKPFVDSTFRTLAGPEDTGLGGSSLGGLVSLYLGLRYPLVFGKLAIFSPSVWWGGREIIRQVRRLKEKLPLRIWLDIGTEEGRASARIAQDVKDLRNALVRKGWVLDRDLKWCEAPGGTHDENAWAQRVDPMLQYLFPPR